MQSIRSGAPSGAVSELRSLMELASDPKKVTAALEALEEKTQEADDAFKKLSEKQALLSKIEKEQDARAKELNALDESLAEKEKALKVLEASVNNVQSGLPAREAALSKKAEEFEDFITKANLEIKSREKLADKRLAEALELKAKIEAAASAHEAKTNKLKEAMGV